MGATIATLAYVLRLTGPLNLTNTHLVLTGRGSCGGFTEGPTPGPGTDRCPDPQEQEPGGELTSLVSHCFTNHTHRFREEKATWLNESQKLRLWCQPGFPGLKMSQHWNSLSPSSQGDTTIPRQGGRAVTGGMDRQTGQTSRTATVSASQGHARRTSGGTGRVQGSQPFSDADAPWTLRTAGLEACSLGPLPSLSPVWTTWLLADAGDACETPGPAGRAERRMVHWAGELQLTRDTRPGILPWWTSPGRSRRDWTAHGAVVYESPRERTEGALVRVSDVPALPTLGPSWALGLGRHWVKKD
ncbi:unnamed protein product [Rangifer tarandus platyrhynchus]|uniref:Uncharacterized protein n=1 Tax=Rangifer tarandus platyrhynchus TaxID=3082113 RepID=A0ABN8ZCC3_RANTA|nr:unnamed protein product [Rangifer tarandus platyrhynchus]